MKTPWFKRCGWFYLPVSGSGVISVFLAAAFAVNVFIAIDRRSHSVSDTLYGIFPFWMPTFLFLMWVASRTSAERER